MSSLISAVRQRKPPVPIGAKPSLTKLEKKEEKLLPAYEAHHTIISRYLGIDQFMVHNYLAGTLCLCLTLAGLTLIILASVDSMHNEHFLTHCCYPEDAPQNQQLGDCRNESAAVHLSSAKRECPAFSWLAYTFFGVGAAALLANHTITGHLKREFDQSAVKESEKMLKYLHEGNPKEALRQVPYHALLFLPESFFLGYHLHTLGKRALAAIYALLVITGIIAALLFFFVAFPLDKAWRCYPDPVPTKVVDGRCDNPLSKAHSKYSVKATQHIPVSLLA